jgi:hypothetical protein
MRNRRSPAAPTPRAALAGPRGRSRADAGAKRTKPARLSLVLRLARIAPRHPCERLPEERREHGAEFGHERIDVVLVADRNARLSQDRTGVEVDNHPVDGEAELGVAHSTTLGRPSVLR